MKPRISKRPPKPQPVDWFGRTMEGWSESGWRHRLEDMIYACNGVNPEMAEYYRQWLSKLNP